MKKPSIFVLVDNISRLKNLPTISNAHKFIPLVVDFDRGFEEEFGRVEKTINDQSGKKGLISITDVTSALASLLNKKLNLQGPTPKSLAIAQHKQLATEIFTDIGVNVCETAFIDPENISEIKQLNYPVFYRPVRSSLSRNSGYAKSEKEFKQIMSTLATKKIPNQSWYENFYNLSLEKYPKLNNYVVQTVVSGRQFTVDGYVNDGRVSIVMITESIMYQDFYSFKEFQMPKNLDHEITVKLKKMLKKFVNRIEFNNSSFNLEFFLTKENKIHFIEFNTRLSPQFVPMLNKVLGINYFDTPASINLGNKQINLKKVNHGFAICNVLRKKSNTAVVKVPTARELSLLSNKYSELLKISVFCKQGLKLSDFPQDSYSYRYADFTIFGKNKKELQMLIPKISNELDKYFIFENTPLLEEYLD